MKLSFKKKRINIKLIKNILFLLLIYVVALVGFTLYQNHENEKISISKTTASIPVLTVISSQEYKTDLYGYTQDMDGCYMRDALVLLDENRKFSFEMNLAEDEIKDLKYEVRSLDTERKISGTSIDYRKIGQELSATVQIENLIQEKEECLLVITLSENEREINYYTRIVLPQNFHEKECLEFADMIHETALSENYMDLKNFFEPKPDVNTTTLNYVDIHSSMDQIGYKGFSAVIEGDVTTAVADATENFMSLTKYFLMSTGSGRNKTYYKVKEYFRVRYTNERMYLLDYNRSINQLLSQNNISFEDNLVNVGLTNPNVEYLSNETGTVVAFVQGGELYSYNQTERRISRVFTFSGEDGDIDKRSIYDQHRIQILNIDESGTMDYVVYGYMNSSQHEGKCGINLYHYDSVTGDSTEQVFISSANSFQVLNTDFYQLMYETADRNLYIMIDGTLMKIDLNTMIVEKLMTGVLRSQYATSASGRYLSYMEEEGVGTIIHTMDLEYGYSYDITAQAGQYLIPLTFMGDNLVYGEVLSANITTDTAGNTIYPMHAVKIVEIGSGGINVLMSYQKSGYFVTDVRLDSYTLYLSRVTLSGGNITPASQDTIQNSAGEQNKAVPIETRLDENKGETVLLTMAPLDKDESLGKIEFRDCSMVAADVVGNVNMDNEKTAREDKYYVYVGSDIILATGNLMEAIQTADDGMGIVINSSQNYIWKRGRSGYRNSIKGISVGASDAEASGSAQALSALLGYVGENVQVHRLLENGDTPISILTRTLKDKKVLDLTGINLGEALYYVDQGTPVYAVTGENEAVLIVGYEASSIIVFDPKTGSNRRIGLTDATNLFETHGNVFIGYLK